jgi:hypothetical protein
MGTSKRQKLRIKKSSVSALGKISGGVGPEIRSALRSDPATIMIGEIKDSAVIQDALNSKVKRR